MRKKKNYQFTTKLWEWPNEKASWFFLSVPNEYYEQIKHSAPQKRGFGSVRIQAAIGQTTWQTSVFPNSRDKIFLLPVKQEIRRAEGFGLDDSVTVKIKIMEN